MPPPLNICLAGSAVQALVFRTEHQILYSQIFSSPKTQVFKKKKKTGDAVERLYCYIFVGRKVKLYSYSENNVIITYKAYKLYIYIRMLKEK